MGRPKKEPDYVRVRRQLRGFRELTAVEKRLFLVSAMDDLPIIEKRRLVIEAIEHSPEVVPELGVGIFERNDGNGEEKHEAVGP